MTSEVIAALIAALLGGGGLVAVIINAFANRKKVAADVVSTLSNAYEVRIKEQDERIDKLVTSVDALELKVRDLRVLLCDRETQVAALQKENDELRLEVDKLSKLVNNKDRHLRGWMRYVGTRMVKSRNNGRTIIRYSPRMAAHPA